MYFPVTFEKFIRTYILKNIWKRLLPDFEMSNVIFQLSLDVSYHFSDFTVCYFLCATKCLPVAEVILNTAKILPNKVVWIITFGLIGESWLLGFLPQFFA